MRHKSRGGGKGPQLRKKNGVQIGVPREFTLDDANKILGLHNTKVKVKPLVPDDLVDPHCLASKKSLTVWKSKFDGAFVLNYRVFLHAIDAAPARRRGDAGSSPLARARMAASSPRNECTRRTG